jgi:hypothetical protein
MVAREAIAAESPSAPAQTALCWYWQIAAVLAATAIVFSRQPAALLHAQFFAEDGHVWFADAYNRGWFVSLFRAQDGYFQTLPRLAAALALLAPLTFAPLVMNFAGLLIQILPVPLLLSTRLRRLGPLSLRATLALTYLAMPNRSEMNVTIEEGQWHLALVACLLLVCSPPPGRAWKLLDIAVFVLCGLTGPFAILLPPIAALRLWLGRERLGLWPLCILVGTAAVQAWALLATHRDYWPLGASAERLVRIVAGQVFLGTILGSNALGARDIMPFLLCVALAGSLLIANCFVNAELEWRLFLIFSTVVFAASLCAPFTPQLRPGSAAWGQLAGTPGIRYWFFPTLAFTWTLVWYLMGRPHRRFCQGVGATLMVMMLTGVFRDWRIPEPKDAHFDSYVAILKGSAPGTLLTIPENPDGWTIQLVKH